MLSKGRDRLESIMLCLLMSVLVFLQGVNMAFFTPEGAPPDEWAHISYVQDSAASKTLLPDYANGTIYNSIRKNYLAHPPLYYSVLGMVSKVFSFSPEQHIFFFRIISALAVSVGFFLSLLAALRFNASPIVLFGITFSTLATPMFGYLAGSINSDNLVYLGVAMFLYGVSAGGLTTKLVDWRNGGFVVLGAFVVSLTKATGAAFIAFYIFIMLVSHRKDALSLLCNRILLRLALPAGAVLVFYYGYVYLCFGSFFPSAGGLYAPSPPKDPVGIVGVAAIFINSMLERLPIAMSHESVYPFNGPGKSLFFVMFFSPLIVWLLCRPILTTYSQDKQAFEMANVLLLATLALVGIHFILVYDGYTQNGLFAGIQPRYYTFLLPWLWLVLLQSLPYKLRSVTATVFAFTAAGAFWASSPVFLLRALG